MRDGVELLTVVSTTGYTYHHPFLGIEIGDQPVTLEADPWLAFQIKEGRLLDVSPAPVRKVDKAKP